MPSSPASEAGPTQPARCRRPLKSPPLRAWQVAGLLAGLLLAGATQAVAMTRAIEFTAEWDEALQARDVQRVTALMRRAKGDMPRSRFGDTPLHKLPAWHESDYVVPVMTALLAHGADVHAATSGGFTPLHWAAFEGAHEAAEWLLAHGANPRLRSTAAYVYADPILAAEWASTVTYPAGLRPYDLAKARHDEVKWSTGKFRRVCELLDKATPREGWFSR